MYRLAYYNSLAIAQLHAAHLRDNGVMAGVIGGQNTAITSMLANNFGKGQYELYISTKRAVDRAQELIDELENCPLDESKEEWDSEPDLTLLSVDHIPSCPGCGYPLDGLAEKGVCPECGKEYGLVKLVFEQFGPEAFEACYEVVQPLAGYSDEQVASIDLDCPGCSYPLDGLGVEGACPECGADFNRRALFSDLIDPG